MAALILSDRQLHTALDILLAQFLTANPDKLPSKTSVLELAAWSYERCHPHFVRLDLRPSNDPEPDPEAA